MFNKISIIGLGLIGGSIAKALRANLPDCHIGAFDTNHSCLEDALAHSAIVRMFHSLDEAVTNTELIILCCPLQHYATIGRHIDKHSLSSTLVTDAGSVKSYAIEALDMIKDRYVPAHPIAGSQQHGFSASTAHLFIGKRIFLTPTADVSKDKVEAIKALWQQTGASEVATIDADKHDATYAAVSHLPQALSFCEPSSLDSLYTSSLMKQHRRISKSHCGLWADIFIANRHHLLPLLRNALSIIKDSEHPEDHQPSSQQKVNWVAYTTAKTVQKLAGSLVEDFAGSGYHDFISVLQGTVEQVNIHQRQQLVINIQHLTEAINNESIQDIAQAIIHPIG